MGSRAQARQQGSRGLPLRPRRAAGEGAARRPRGCCGQWWPATGTPLATPPQVWCGPRGLARRSARPWRCNGCSRRSGAPRCRPPRLRCHWHWRGPVSAAAPARPLGRGQPRPGRRASRPRPPTQRSYRGGPAVQRCAGGAEWSPGRQASRNSTRLRGSSLLPGCAHGAERGPGRRASRYPTRPRRSSALPGTSLAAARRRRGCRGSMPRTGRRHGQRRRREGSLPAYAATQPGLTRGCDGWQVHCSCRLASSCGRRTCLRGPPSGGQEPTGSQAADGEGSNFLVHHPDAVAATVRRRSTQRLPCGVEARSGYPAASMHATTSPGAVSAPDHHGAEQVDETRGGVDLHGLAARRPRRSSSFLSSGCRLANFWGGG